MKAPVTPELQVLNRAGKNLFYSVASGVYYAIFRRDGKQIRRSLKTPDRKLAELRGKVERLTTDHAKPPPFAEWQVVMTNVLRIPLKNLDTEKWG